MSSLSVSILRRAPTNEPVSVDFKKYPHMLISAPTNSGKSYLIRYILGVLELHLGNTPATAPQVIILDYKNGSDYWQWRGAGNVFLGDDVYEGFRQAYAIFEKRRQNPEREFPPLFVIFEEYQSTIASIEKKADKEVFLKLVGNWLRLSRQVNCHLICVCQRIDASVFPAGGRENFSIRLSIGRLSPQAKQMMFPDDEVNCNKGQGEVNIQFDGQPVIEGKTYTIQSEERAQALITHLIGRGIK